MVEKSVRTVIDTTAGKSDTPDRVEQQYDVQKLEVFEKPALPELEMQYKWTMWEHYETL